MLKSACESFWIMRTLFQSVLQSAKLHLSDIKPLGLTIGYAFGNSLASVRTESDHCREPLLDELCQHTHELDEQLMSGCQGGWMVQTL